MACFNRSSHTRLKINNLFLNLDRIKTDSHRFKPNSCTVLIDEQSNYLHRLQCKATAKSTSRWQSSISLRTLNWYNSVIPEVLFSCWSNIWSSKIFGSLNSTNNLCLIYQFYSLTNILLFNQKVKYFTYICLYRLCYNLKGYHPNKTNRQ